MRSGSRHNYRKSGIRKKTAGIIAVLVIAAVVAAFAACDAGGEEKGKGSGFSQKSEEAGDKITIDAPADLPTYADHDRFVQILFNIVQNAVQFTKNGQITIKAKVGYHQTEFAISDTGIGMSKDQM